MNTDFYLEINEMYSNEIPTSDYIESSEPGVIQIEDDRKMSYLLMKYSNKNK